MNAGVAARHDGLLGVEPEAETEPTAEGFDLSALHLEGGLHPGPLGFRRRHLEGAALTALARTLVWRDSAEAKAVGRRAVELLAPGGASVEAARAYGELAGLHIFDNEDEPGQELAEIGLRMAEEVSDRGLQALALN